MKYAEYVNSVSEENQCDVYTSIAREQYDDLKSKILQQAKYGRRYIFYNAGREEVASIIKKFLIDDGFRIDNESKNRLNGISTVFLDIKWD